MRVPRPVKQRLTVLSAGTFDEGSFRPDGEHRIVCSCDEIACFMYEDPELFSQYIGLDEVSRAVSH